MKFIVKNNAFKLTTKGFVHVVAGSLLLGEKST